MVLKILGIVFGAILATTVVVIGAQKFMDSRENPAEHFANPKTLELAEAIMANDREKVDALLASGADINAQEPDGLTLLHWQVLRNDLSRSAWLMDLGANPSIQSVHGETAVSIAAANRSPHLLERLLERGADPNAVSKRLSRTPIFVALDSRYEDNVDLLIEHGADLEYADRQGSRPLSHAAAINSSHYVRRFLELGADPQAKDNLGLTFQSSFFRTDPAILNSKAKSDRAWVVKFLTARGIPVQAN